MTTNAVDLKTFEAEANATVEGIEQVKHFIATYGELVPGLNLHGHSLAEIERNVVGALTLFNGRAERQAANR